MELITTRPLALRLDHSLVYDPVARTAQVESSEWRVDRLETLIFGGAVSLHGHGSIGAERTDDVATTVTLKGIDVQALLRFLEVPRAADIEALADGTLAVQVRGGEFERVDVKLIGRPGTVRISRGLLKQILSPYFGGGLESAQVDKVLDQFFGGQRMIPLESMSIEGQLGMEKLTLQLPLRNEALNILIEPRIERGLLWEIWEYLKGAGLRNVSEIEWNMTSGR